ncbi:MAG: DinB family protein [Chloroflexi bacterium]|nr:DinB family protein [Chloroflexota bacterium]
MNIRCSLVVDELARHRVQFEHLCRSLDADELRAVIPGSHWTVRDYIAHLATIDGLIAPGFSTMVGLSAPPPEPPLPTPFDIDEWNEAAVRARESKTMDELLAEAATHRGRMAAAIERMTDADLDRIIPYGGDRKTLGLAPTRVRFGGLLWGIAIHDPTHTQDILRALPHRREEAWLTDWLGSVNDSLVPAGVKEQRV